MKKNIFILGANGYIGKRVSITLENNISIRENYNLTLHSRRRKIEEYCGDTTGYNRVFGDITKPESLACSLLQADVLINCGFDKSAIDKNCRIYEYLLSKNKISIEKIVHIGSLVSFVDTDGVISEECNRFGLKSPYARAKLNQEMLLRQLNKKFGTQIIILHPGIVFGNEPSQWMMQAYFEILSGRICLPLNGMGHCHATNVNDIAECCLHALRQRSLSFEEYVIGTEDKVTWIEFYCFVSNYFGLSLRVADKKCYDEPQNFLDRTARKLRNWRYYFVKWIGRKGTDRSLFRAAKFFSYHTSYWTEFVPESPQRISLLTSQSRLDCTKARREFGVDRFSNFSAVA